MSEYDIYPRGTWLEIDTGRLTANAQAWRDLAETRVLMVVKANAYGHGLLQAAQAFAKADIAYLGVANCAEGAVLRAGGITHPILVMGYVSAAEVDTGLTHDLDLFFWSPQQLDLYAAAATRLGRRFRGHLKVDTGMGRLGCKPENAEAVLRHAATLAAVEVTGIASHFAASDSEDLTSAELQLERFEAVLAGLEAQGLRPAIAHIANTPATLRMPRSRLDMCRVGIGAYGLRPDPEIALPEGILPALAWYGTVGPTEVFEPGAGISYGAEYRTTEQETIAVLPLGYADGFRRSPRSVNSILVDGVEYPTVGRICMDQCLVRLPSAASEGQTFVIIGQSGDKTLTADDLADRWNTNCYDVVCGINARVPRRFI